MPFWSLEDFLYLGTILLVGWDGKMSAIEDSNVFSASGTCKVLPKNVFVACDQHCLARYPGRSDFARLVPSPSVHQWREQVCPSCHGLFPSVGSVIPCIRFGLFRPWNRKRSRERLNYEKGPSGIATHKVWPRILVQALVRCL